MAKTRGAFGIVSLILLATALLFMFFVVLSGLSNVTPLKKTYFLTADTSAINGARPVSQWTYFYICGAGNQDCGSPVPALPFGYPWSTGTGAGAPEAILGTHGKHTTSTYYYYMWRFGWVFYLMGLVTTAGAFVLAFIAPCSRLGSAFAGSITMLALFFFTIGASLMTAVFVKARDAFNANGMTASLGRYAFGWTWGAWFALFLSMLMLFFGCCMGRERSDNVRSTNGAGYGSGNRGFFRRQRSRKSVRGSFVDNESQRRVKDEYS